MFLDYPGTWTELRNLKPNKEVDFHYHDRKGYDSRETTYGEKVTSVYNIVLEELQSAYDNGIPYVLFSHGWSTSGPWKRTARSAVRFLMRSKKTTPFIIRKLCIQYESVFLAVIRPKR